MQAERRPSSPQPAMKPNSSHSPQLSEHNRTRDPDSVHKSSLETAEWEGPDDPENPRNWSSSKKNIHVIMISLFTLNANLAATMFAPGAEDLASDFAVTNDTVIAMTVSLYVLGFALGPLILAPLSEMYGRLPIYHSCNLGYIAFTLGCAFSTNVDMFLAFRFIAGCAASGPMTVGGGTIADLTAPEERGKAMALFAIGPLLGPVVGPVIGGFVTEYIGWRWTFRIILILASIIGVATFVLVRETSALVLLRQKAKRLVKEAGKESSLSDACQKESSSQLLRTAIVRPLKLLIFSPIIMLVSLYTGVMFGLIFLLFTTFPSVFGDTYGFDAGMSGLVYLGLGIGMMFGLALFRALSDKLLGQKDGAKRPEDRLILMKWIGPITPLGLFMYGWSAAYKTHWIVPILGTFIVGLGSLFIVIPGQIYLVDSFGAEAAASAMAANMLVRSPFGAFLDLAAAPLYQRLGLGWGNSVLGFICLAFTPVPWLFHAYGAKLRTRFEVKL